MNPAASLYNELAGRGVRLTIAPTPAGGELPPLRLRVQAPPGALTPGLKEALERRRADLLDFVFELEERAAIHLERKRSETTAAEWEGALNFARTCVRGAGALPDAALLDVAEHHPGVRAVAEKFGGLQIVGVRRAEESGAA